MFPYPRCLIHYVVFGHNQRRDRVDICTTTFHLEDSQGFQCRNDRVGRLTPSYSGDASFNGSSDTETHVVTQPELALNKQPSSTAVSGVAFEQQPEAELQDGNGKHLDLAGIAVTVSLASGGGTLSGTVTRTTDGHGRVGFDDLAITGPLGTYTLQFSAGGFTPVTSDPITLVGAP